MKKLILMIFCIAFLIQLTAGAITITRTNVLDPVTNVSAVPSSVAGDLTPGQEYCYKIKVTDSSNYGYWSNSSEEVCAVANSSGSINISWDYSGSQTRFMIWRTPISGNYSFIGNNNANYDRDKHAMFLRNGYYWYKNRYTIKDQHYFVDTGSASERPSGYDYYREWMNFEHIEGEQATLNIDTSSCDECANFNDIHNAYPNRFRRLYGNEDGSGYQIYETDDRLNIDGCFQDRDFTLITRGNVDMNDDTCSKRLGYYSSSIGHTWGDWQIISNAPGGRQNTINYKFKNTGLYAGKLLRDYGEAYEYDYQRSYIDWRYAPTSTTSLYSGTTAIDMKRANNDQYCVLQEDNGIKIDRWDDYKNVRGFKANADQAANSFNDIRHYHHMFLSNNVDNQNVTIRGANPLHNGNEFRFYIVENATTILIDPIADAPGITGLPSTATTYNGKNNKLFLKWSVDLRVQDILGNPISNASVSFTDRFGNVWENKTDENGQIDTLVLTQAYYTHSVEVGDTHFDITNSSNPYTIKISKEGYMTEEFKYNITKTEDMSITLMQPIFKIIKIANNALGKLIIN